MRRALLALVLLGACAASGPVALRWGEEGCRHCHMTLADKRYGAELVSTTGKVYAFDDAGCAADFLADGSLPVDEVGQVWMIDYMHPDSLIDGTRAAFVRSPAFQTPMGSGVIATSDAEAASRFARGEHAVRYSWQELLADARAGDLRHS